MRKMIEFMYENVVQLFVEDGGATAIEYGLIAALVAVAAITAMTSLGAQIGKTLNNTTTSMAAG
jgi:pilus assembly protein Flp/PilA